MFELISERPVQFVYPELAHPQNGRLLADRHPWARLPSQPIFADHDSRASRRVSSVQPVSGRAPVQAPTSV